MQFITNFFKHEGVIGLCGLRKQTLERKIPLSYKKTFIPNTEKNYLLNS